MNRYRLLVANALLLAPLRENRGRSVLALAAVAIGVALGVAVHVINDSALGEFESAARRLAGTADLSVQGSRAGFDESLYPVIARLPGVAAANPAIDAEAALVGRTASLRLIGFDPLRAAQLQPALLPARREMIPPLLEPGAVALSPAAARWLGLAPGDTLRIVVGAHETSLTVSGLLPEGVYRQRLGLMDIASAQWLLGRLGRIDRIDLSLRPGTDAALFRAALQKVLPPGVHAVRPGAEADRAAFLTRAYRLNLEMLALVALFTGAFLIFSSQVLSLLRRRTQLAVVRTLGLSRGALARYVIIESALLGLLGSGAGIALGYGLAGYALAHFGADLGAGYFRDIDAALRLDAVTFVRFLLLGTGFTVLGAALPAWEAARRLPARSLRAGDEEDALAPLRSPWPGFLLTALGLALTMAPAVDGMPLAGYGAIALLLLGAVLLMPWLVSVVLACLPTPGHAVAGVAVARLKATPRQAAIAVAAILASVSLTVAMLIMVDSFRSSLTVWLEQILPADLYLRSAHGGETAFLTPESQARIAATPGLARVEFLRARKLLLTPELPPLTLLAGEPHSAASLPLRSPAIMPPPHAPPAAWVSEVAADLHGWRTGATIRLPIAGSWYEFTVAGVWRDYARQAGAVSIARATYIDLTGDRLANDAAIWLAPGTSRPAAAQALRERLPDAAAIEIADTAQLRARSLTLFDRTFAITYALEVAAIVIGLFGVAASFGAQVLARRREFGVLRHLGMSRREIAALLATEGGLVAGLGVAAGLALGWIIGLVLIHVVNRQSFHWSMEVYVPGPQLAGVAFIVVAAALVTAVISGRAAMSDDVVRSVREDW